jgi:hypothetical protein
VFRRQIVSSLARILLAPLVLLVLAAGATAASVSVGETSQHGVVRVLLGKHRVVMGVIIELKTRCTDHKRRDIWPGFLAPFEHPQDANGRLNDSYDIVGRDASTGVRYSQHASFGARRTQESLSGSAIVTQTVIRTGVTCRSPRVTFSVQL